MHQAEGDVRDILLPHDMRWMGTFVRMCSFLPSGDTGIQEERVNKRFYRLIFIVIYLSTLLIFLDPSWGIPSSKASYTLTVSSAPLFQVGAILYELLLGRTTLTLLTLWGTCTYVINVGKPPIFDGLYHLFMGGLLLLYPHCPANGSPLVPGWTLEMAMERERETLPNFSQTMMVHDANFLCQTLLYSTALISDERSNVAIETPPFAYHTESLHVKQ